MRAVDAGGALLVPPGDPDGVREGARALLRAAAAMDGAARGAVSAGTSGGREWRGPAASSFVARTASTSAGMRELADGFAAAGRALDEFAEVLADAQRRARQAQDDLVAAGGRYRRSLEAAADEAQRAAEAHAERVLDAARAHAQREAERAQDAVDAAARRAAGRLQAVVDAVRAVTVHDLLGWLGGPDVAFGLMGLFGQGVSAKALYDARKALLAGDFDELARRDPAGYRRVLQVAAQYGDDSMEALAAQVRWQSGVFPRLIGQMSDASVPVGAVPVGQMARALDLLAKVGVVTSVVSNGYTILGGDEKTTTTDRWVAGANTAGLVMAGTGSATAMGLIGLSATTGWIPVAGQVVLAVTAAYMAVDWYRDNREAVHAFVAGIDDGVGAAADWTQQQLREYADEVRRELETARDTVEGVVQTGGQLLGEARERGEQLLDDAGEVVSDVRDTAGRAVSSLNPFD